MAYGPISAHEAVLCAGHGLLGNMGEEGEAKP